MSVCRLSLNASYAGLKVGLRRAASRSRKDCLAEGRVSHDKRIDLAERLPAVPLGVICSAVQCGDVYAWMPLPASRSSKPPAVQPQMHRCASCPDYDDALIGTLTSSEPVNACR